MHLQQTRGIAKKTANIQRITIFLLRDYKSSLNSIDNSGDYKAYSQYVIFH